MVKVDSFLNHQMDVELFLEMAKEFKSKFASHNINKILTIESSGIGIAAIAGLEFGVPCRYLQKKSKSINIEVICIQAEVESFTHKCKNQVIVSKKFFKC